MNNFISTEERLAELEKELTKLRADRDRWREHRYHLMVAESLALREVEVRYQRAEKKLSACEVRYATLEKEFNMLKLNRSHP